jgi:hypothetical protein
MCQSHLHKKPPGGEAPGRWAVTRRSRAGCSQRCSTVGHGHDARARVLELQPALVVVELAAVDAVPACRRAGDRARAAAPAQLQQPGMQGRTLLRHCDTARSASPEPSPLTMSPPWHMKPLTILWNLQPCAAQRSPGPAQWPARGGSARHCAHSARHVQLPLVLVDQGPQRCCSAPAPTHPATHLVVQRLLAGLAKPFLAGGQAAEVLSCFGRLRPCGQAARVAVTEELRTEERCVSVALAGGGCRGRASARALASAAPAAPAQPGIREQPPPTSLSYSSITRRPARMSCGAAALAAPWAAQLLSAWYASSSIAASSTVSSAASLARPYCVEEAQLHQLSSARGWNRPAARELAKPAAPHRGRSL